MAGTAEDQGFSMAGRHDLNPSRFFSACVLFQIFECADVMDFDLVCHAGCPTVFTDLGQKPFFQFRPTSPSCLGRVLYGRVDLPYEWDASPCSYQRFLSLTRDGDLQSFVAFPLDIQVGLVLLVDLGHRYLVFPCQRLCQRDFHHPFELVKRVKVVSHPVVVDDPPIFKLIRCNDGVVTLVEQLCSMHGSVLLQVALAFLLHDGWWHTQADVSIDPSVFPPVFIAIVLAVALQGGDLVSQEFGRLTPCVGNQGLFLRQIELECFKQECSELLLDLFCLFLWADECQGKIVGVPAIA